MANYLYKTVLYKSGATVINKPASNDADRTDFETNFKATALKVDNVLISETTFVLELTYAQFKAKIIAPILWSDVKHIEDEAYRLNLLSATIL